MVRTHLASLVSVACLGAAGAALATPVVTPVYYTRYGIDNPADFTETNVRRFDLTYDRATGVVTYGPRISVARTLGADGIVFAPDSTPGDNRSDLLVGGMFQGLVHRLRIDTLSTSVVDQRSVNCGNPDAYHLAIDPRDPSNPRVWTGGLPGPLAEVPLTESFATNGTVHPVSGDETSVTSLAFVPLPAGGYDVFYTKSPPNGPGTFGRINMATFQTTRLMDNIEAAHGMLFDAHSQSLILTGETRMTQIDPFTNPPSIISELDWDTVGVPALDLDQSTADGRGIVLGASNDGRLVFVDYFASRRIGDPSNPRYVEFLDTFLDDVAPLSGPGSQEPECCPLGSGAFDRRSAQLSQIPGISTIPFDYRTADDFYLLPGRMYRISKITGTMITDSILPKARLEIYKDCNGLPADPPIRVEPLQSAIRDVGTFQGKRVLEIDFTFTDFWLEGGESYWVSFIGAGTGDANEQWFWGTAGTPTGGSTPVINGRPGAFKSVINGLSNWTPLDSSSACANCIGCTDFAFCVEATSCKILLDNGTFDVTGTASLQNLGSVLARAADDFVVPPCTSGRICYIEAYIATNCPTSKLDVYDVACAHPRTTTPIATLVPRDVINTGEFVTIDGVRLPVLCLRFYDFPLTLTPGRNYAVSAYGDGNGNANFRAYFLHNRDCKRQCLISFFEGWAYGPIHQCTEWTRVSQLGGPARDFSFLIAMDDSTQDVQSNPGGAVACNVDLNNDQQVTIADVFEYLNAFFDGCP